MRLNLQMTTLILLVYLFVPKTIFSQTSIKIYADPENAPGLKASKFIDSIDFIPLETNKESKYENLNQFIVADSNLIVMDGTNHVLIFDKKGKFCYQFKNEKRRFRINNIQYVPSKNALLIVSYNKNYTISDIEKQKLVKKWQGRDISKYVSLEWLFLGKNITRQKVFAPSLALNKNITYFDSGFIYRNYSYDKYNKDSVAYRLVQYGYDNKLSHRYFPYLNLPKLWSSYEDYELGLSIGSTPRENSTLFQLDFSPVIYELYPDTIVQRYQFVFPMANVMPADFSSLRFNNNIDFQKYKEKNKKAISYFYNMLEHDKYLFFGMNTLDDEGFDDFLMMNNVVYSLGKLTTDSSIHNLPPNIFSSMSDQDKHYVYTYANASTILQQKTSLLADPHVSQAFKEYLNKMAPNDNHIVIRVKLK